MPDFYVRVEGVNLDSFVNDTNDISTVRGGSLLLLDVVGALAARLESTADVISTGASAGLFRLSAPDRSDAIGKVESALAAIGTGNSVDQSLKMAIRYASLLIDVVEADDPKGFVNARERIRAETHWHQMMAPALAIPSPGKDEAPDLICDIDGVRPAEFIDQWIKGGERNVSASVYNRRRYGRDQKQSFYVRQTNGAWHNPRQLQFAQDFRTLAEGADARFRRLDGKIAVIYIDGNGFTKIQDAYIAAGIDAKDGVHRQKEFDDKLKAHRRDMLTNLLNTIDQSDDRWLSASGSEEADKEKRAIRLETLMWGGDEIVWVVPAWLGWWLLSFFFDTALGRNTGKPWEIDGTALQHAAGLVFCHSKAPIARTRQLAEQLAKEAKSDRSRSYVAYQVLESFDHIGRDLQTFRRQQCPPGVDLSALNLPAEQLDAAVDRLVEVKRVLPRRRLKQIVDTIVQEPERFDDVKTRLLSGLPDQDALNAALDALQTCFGTGPAMWLHIETLWDYIAPEESDAPA